VIVDGDPPPEAVEVDWDAVKAESEKEVPEYGTYTLTWVSHRLPDMRLTTRISLRNPAIAAFPPG
jgi:hypothetical protein